MEEAASNWPLDLLQHRPQAQATNSTVSKSWAGDLNESFLKELEIWTFEWNALFFQMLTHLLLLLLLLLFYLTLDTPIRTLMQGGLGQQDAS